MMSWPGVASRAQSEQDPETVSLLVAPANHDAARSEDCPRAVAAAHVHTLRINSGTRRFEVAMGRLGVGVMRRGHSYGKGKVLGLG